MARGMEHVTLTGDEKDLDEIVDKFMQVYGNHQHYLLLRLLCLDPEVQVVCELGTNQGGSAAVMLNSDIKYLFSYDLHPENCDFIKIYGKVNCDTYWKLMGEFDSVGGTPVRDCDLLLIDTVHTEEHVWKELNIHSGRVKKFIVVHDTMRRTVADAVYRFQLRNSEEWKVVKVLMEYPGTMVLQRKDEPCLV